MRISDWSSDVCSSDLYLIQPKAFSCLHICWRTGEEHMATTQTTYEKEIASIKSDLSALRDDMGRLTKTISDSVAAEARTRSARLRDTAESARAEIERLAAEARERGEEGGSAGGRQSEGRKGR